jgi:hypothetical protein
MSVDDVSDYFSRRLSGCNSWKLSAHVWNGLKLLAVVLLLDAG